MGKTEITFSPTDIFGECQTFELSKIIDRIKYIYIYGILYALKFLAFRTFDTLPILCTKNLLLPTYGNRTAILSSFVRYSLSINMATLL